MLRSIPSVLVVLCLAACSSGPRNTCAKAKECCATMSRCEEINREGQGWEDRCEIDLSASIEKYQTFGQELCNTISSRLSDYVACLGSLQCSDLSGDDGRAAKCDTQARAYCNALKSSGDACGNDWSRLSCDSYEAELWLGF